MIAGVVLMFLVMPLSSTAGSPPALFELRRAGNLLPCEVIIIFSSFGISEFLSIH